LPVSKSFLPKDVFLSSKITFLHFSLALIAAIIPAGPPPITIISEEFFIKTSL